MDYHRHHQWYSYCCHCSGVGKCWWKGCHCHCCHFQHPGSGRVIVVVSLLGDRNGVIAINVVLVVVCQTSAGGATVVIVTMLVGISSDGAGGKKDLQLPKVKRN